MNKIIAFTILFFLLCFFVFYQVKFQHKKSYIVDGDFPYFKEENDVLKVYDLKELEPDIAVNATVYDVITKTEKDNNKIKREQKDKRKER